MPVPGPGSVTEAELATVEMIAVAMGSVASQPACPGPLLVHHDGAFECHGAGCPGGLAIFHSDDVVEPCGRQAGIRTRHACPRCMAHSDDAGLAGPACAGLQIQHDDGTAECTAGGACPGAQAIHMSSRSCRLLGPCPRNCQPAL